MYFAHDISLLLSNFYRVSKKMMKFSFGYSVYFSLNMNGNGRRRMVQIIHLLSKK